MFWKNWEIKLGAACPFFLIFPHLSFHRLFCFSKFLIDATNYSATCTYLLCIAIGGKLLSTFYKRPPRTYFVSSSSGFPKFALAENRSETWATSRLLTLAYEIGFWFNLSSNIEEEEHTIQKKSYRRWPTPGNLLLFEWQSCLNFLLVVLSILVF